MGVMQAQGVTGTKASAFALFGGNGFPMRCRGFTDRTDRPIRGDPFAGRMSQQGRELDLTARLVDGGGLDRSDLMLAKAFADDIGWVQRIGRGHKSPRIVV
jgi:hypothetical protein